VVYFYFFNFVYKIFIRGSVKLFRMRKCSMTNLKWETLTSKPFGVMPYPTQSRVTMFSEQRVKWRNTAIPPFAAMGEGGTSSFHPLPPSFSQTFAQRQPRVLRRPKLMWCRYTVHVSFEQVFRTSAEHILFFSSSSVLVSLLIHPLTFCRSS
jgi:hypothetical protein